MKLLEKILVATDFEKSSEEALHLSIFLAKEFHSEIILFHVIPEFKNYPMAKNKIRKNVTEKLKQMAGDLKRKGISSVDPVTCFGIPFEKIIEYSDELVANVIVLGSGQGGKKLQWGTTAEKVMIYANKPVFMVKRGSAPHIRKILCPVDFSESSKRGLKNAILLSRTFDAPLTVLTVFEPLLSSFFGIGSTPGESKEKAMVKRQQQQFDRFLRGFNLENLPWRKMILRGKPHQEILRAIQETKSDLLVMGSTGKTGLTRRIMSSTAEKVIREMPCSVVTLKQEHLLQFDLEKEMTDIEAHLRKGKELLQKKLTEGALTHFEDCIRRDIFFIPAWDEMAVAYRQMGKVKEAKKCEEMAAYLRRHLWKNELER